MLCRGQINVAGIIITATVGNVKIALSDKVASAVDVPFRALWLSDQRN